MEWLELAAYNTPGPEVKTRAHPARFRAAQGLAGAGYGRRTDRAGRSTSGKGATLSDVTARKEYGVAADCIVKGTSGGKLEYRDRAIRGNPYFAC